MHWNRSKKSATVLHWRQKESRLDGSASMGLRFGERNVGSGRKYKLRKNIGKTPDVKYASVDGQEDALGWEFF